MSAEETKDSGPFQDRRRKLQRLRDSGIDPYSQEYRPDREIGEIRAEFDTWDAESLGKLDTTFSIAGRLMARRDFGKVAFLDVLDRSGKIQCFVQKAQLNEEERLILQCLDIGDHMGVWGGLFRTRTGELTIRAEGLKILSKALRPLPEKWHGLRDVEARYRQRYLDLLMNPDVRRTFETRTRIIRILRDFLDQKGFLEVETPMMQPIPGGAEARPFVTHHNALDRDLYLRIAPELYLKRLVVGGFEKVYEINRNFRNEGISTQHNPEFTMLEFYWAYATFEDLMELTEELLETLVQELHGRSSLTYQGTQVEFSRPWSRIRFFDALEQIGGVPRNLLEGEEERLRKWAHQKGIPLEGRKRRGKVLAKIFDTLVEPHLQSPTFVTHYPVEISPLSRRNLREPQLVDRFELFIAGREIANAFTELTDPDDQRERFLEQRTLREEGDEEAHPLDEDFLRALEHGMPPTAGEGIGVDRLVMLLTDSASIRDVILFPQLRHEGPSG